MVRSSIAVALVAVAAGCGGDATQPAATSVGDLFAAAAADDGAAVDAILDAGVDADRRGPEGLTALHVAAQADAVATVEVLLDAGADPSVRSTNGMNALDHAAAGGSDEVIELLVAAGADPDARSEVVTQGHGWPIDRGPTPMAIAARADEVAAVRALLDAGADVDATSATGQTALLAAVFADASPDVVAALLDAGADPAIEVGCVERCNDPPAAAGTWARRLGRDDLVAVLE